MVSLSVLFSVFSPPSVCVCLCLSVSPFSFGLNTRMSLLLCHKCLFTCIYWKNAAHFEAFAKFYRLFPFSEMHHLQSSLPLTLKMYTIGKQSPRWQCTWLPPSSAVSERDCGGCSKRVWEERSATEHTCSCHQNTLKTVAALGTTHGKRL